MGDALLAVLHPGQLGLLPVHLVADDFQSQAALLTDVLHFPCQPAPHHGHKLRCAHVVLPIVIRTLRVRQSQIPPTIAFTQSSLSLWHTELDLHPDRGCMMVNDTPTERDRHPATPRLPPIPGPALQPRLPTALLAHRRP